jgi:hypothetical protein
MGFVHHCVFCGWQKEGSSATMLRPRCECCGCTLVATPTSDFAAPEPRAVAGWRPPLDPRLMRAGRLLLLASVLAGAARAGHVEGGPALALAAFGLAGLLGVPLAVED